MSRKTSFGISPWGQYSPHASSTDACSLVMWTCAPTFMERRTSNRTVKARHQKRPCLKHSLREFDGLRCTKTGNLSSNMYRLSGSLRTKKPQNKQEDNSPGEV
eukprot:316143-Amphidinium_carterae.2